MSFIAQKQTFLETLIFKNLQLQNRVLSNSTALSKGIGFLEEKQVSEAEKQSRKKKLSF